MVHAHWIGFAFFMAGVLAVALYGLTASGHFPAEARSAKFKGGCALVLWGTLAVTVLAAAAQVEETSKAGGSDGAQSRRQDSTRDRRQHRHRPRHRPGAGARGRAACRRCPAAQAAG